MRDAKQFGRMESQRQDLLGQPGDDVDDILRGGTGHGADVVHHARKLVALEETCWQLEQ